MPPKAPAKAGGKKTKSAPLTGVAALKAKAQMQREYEEKARIEAEREEARLREEERLAEEQRKREEEERKLREEEEKVKGKTRQVEQTKERANEAIERMRAAGLVLPDEAMIELARNHDKSVSQVPKPAHKPKQKPAASSGVSSNQQQQSAKTKTESDVSSDEDVPPEPDTEEFDDWEELEEKNAQRDAILARNEARSSRREERAAKKAAEDEAAAAASAADNAVSQNVLELRSPILVVMGHVDTGKTSLLDRVRRTNVQGGEAGGITQQIGATFFPHEALVTATEELNARHKVEIKVPGLLVIDTPGHESFSNLRSRGSSLCDIAVLVIDIMHGLEPQTRESINMLRLKKVPFMVALNKVDRCLDWEAHENMDIESSLKLQKPHTVQEFETRTQQVLSELQAEGYNAELYWRNTDSRRTISVVPTSAKTGEGIPDLLLLKVKLVQQYLEGKVAFKNDLQCTVLEVKPVQGIGTTVDVVLVNGTLNEGDRMILCGMNGPIDTQVRSLLTPQPMRELRVKAEYIHHKSIRAAMGVKLCAQDLEDVVPGTPLFVYHNDEERERYKKEVMSDLGSILKQIDHTGVGVTVQSSTLGALEALLSFLKDSDIPVSSIALGPLHKKHLQHTLAMRQRTPRFAVVLAFDVPITRDAQEFATANKIPVFEAKIIYHLFDMFERYMTKCDEEQMEKDKNVAVFPVVLNSLAQIRDRPMILQATVAEGHLRTGTPLCTIVENGTVKLPIGNVISIQREGRDIKIAAPGQQVAIKVVPANQSLHFGRQFGERDTLYSNMTRESIDALKTSFLNGPNAVPKEDWNVVRTLKDLLGIGGPTGAAAASSGGKK